MIPKDRIIIKSSGNPQKFSQKKWAQSLIRCGLDPKKASETTRLIIPKMKTSTTSRKLFELTQRHLHQFDRPIAYRYSLKRALFELGPTGFPFEQLIARVFEKLGYQVITNQMIQGRCVRHEVDAVAENQDEKSWIECKFHNDQGISSDLKTSLYVYARYLDLKEFDHSDQRTKKMALVSNTRFTSEAIQFANCRGLKLLGWDFPAQDSLSRLLEKFRLFPVTVISDLNRRQKEVLLSQSIITTSDLMNRPKIANRIKISSVQWQKICQNIDALNRSI